MYMNFYFAHPGHVHTAETASNGNLDMIALVIGVVLVVGFVAMMIVRNNVRRRASVKLPIDEQ